MYSLKLHKQFPWLFIPIVNLFYLIVVAGINAYAKNKVYGIFIYIVYGLFSMVIGCLPWFIIVKILEGNEILNYLIFMFGIIATYLISSLLYFYEKFFLKVEWK